MAATQVLNTVLHYGESETTVLQKTEWIIGSSSDLTSIPDVAPGSVAYTADLTSMYIWDGTEWKAVGGA